ncbi:MAG: hypothetical protein AAGF57_10740 [Pseudomonadota bacterium]
MMRLFLACLALTAMAAHAREWGADELQVEIGSGKLGASGLVLTPDASGRAYVTFKGRYIDLNSHTEWRIETDTERPWETFIVWQTRQGGDSLYQYKIPGPMRYNPIVVSTQGVKNWQGNAREFGLGFRLPAGNQLTLRGVALKPHSIVNVVDNWVYDWSSLKPWQAYDINLYTGTRRFGEGQHPVTVFAAASILALTLLFLWWLLHRPNARYVLAGAGALVLTAWIALDLFWQVRLWKQLENTQKTLGGKSTDERIRSSKDGAMWQFAESVKPFVSPMDSRVFVASDVDSKGLVATYYLTPLNTSWNRRGALLPDANQFRAGDYIALIKPTAFVYLPEKKQLRVAETVHLPVEQVFSSREGALYKVLP